MSVSIVLGVMIKMKKTIPLSVPNLSGNEKKYMDEAIAAEWVSTAGPYIGEFEKGVAGYVGAPEAVACQSGTAGLHLAVMESGLARGERVLVPALTFIATVNPVVYAGGEPVFIDCDDTLCMDPVKLEDFCRDECELRGGALYEKASGARVRAVMPVHVFGNLCDMEAIEDTAKRYGLFVIEDAAEALGSRWLKGRHAGMHAGTVGDIGVFSFNGNKIITTGGGGMIVAKDRDKLAHMRYLSTQAKDDTLRFIHNEVGYNYRMTNIQAALGVAQLEQLEGFVKIKNRNYDLYRALGVELWPFRDDIKSNRWFYSLVTDGRRDELMEKLAERGIMTRPIWELMNHLKPFKRYRAYRIERAEYFHKNLVNLPCSTNLSEDDVRETAAAVREILG